MGLKDNLENLAEEAKGKIQEATGKARGDEQQEAEGQATQSGANAKPLDQHGPAGNLLRNVGRDHMVGHQIGQLLEPPQRQLGQHGALVRDLRVEHEVVGRDPVRGD